MMIQSAHWAFFCIALCILMEGASWPVTKDGYVESCPHLLYVRKGKLLNYGRELGNVVTVQCNEGYVFHGNPSLKCERHQKYNIMAWNTTLNSFGCEKDLMYCPHQHVSNGHCSLKDQSIHSIRTCECNQGYTLEGHSKSSCQSDKTWSHSAPKCQMLTVRICSRNGIIKDGQCTYSSFNGNNRLERTCNCNTGFELKGTSKATCGPSEGWSSSLPTCIKSSKSCPRLVNPQFGYLSNYTAIYNQSVTYYCHKGYYVDTRNGTNTRRCLDTGRWSGRAPSCQRKSCPPLRPPLFGNVSNIAAATYDQSVTYYCDKGYRLITRHGLNTRRCLDTGGWSGWAPFCQHVCADSSLKCRTTETCAVDSIGKAHCQCMDVADCPSKLNPVCGSDGKNYNNTCIMKLKSCKEGKHNTTVDGGGNCHFAHCEVAEPANGYVTVSPTLQKSRLPLDTYVTYKCHEWNGYLINGIQKSIQLKCTGPGKWSKPTPTCSLVRCDNPENPVNGVCTATATTFGSTKTCSCNHGYRLGDPSLATTTCKLKDSNGQWSSPTPSCQLILCRDLSKSSILHGTVNFNGRRHGNTTEYRCNEGYELIGDLKRECQENETWTGSAPTCKIKRCKGLSHPKHGFVSSSESRPYGSTVSYTCEPGYQLRYGSSVRECLSTSQWNGTQPMCQRETFHCSKCHKDANCILNSFCHCKSGFVGNGKYCCSEDIGSQVTLSGSTAHFRCDSRCNIPFDRVAWFKDGIGVSSLPKRYGLANDGLLLYLENVTSDDSGQYSCLIHFSGLTVKRYGTLEVVDSNVLSSCSLDCGKSCSKKPFVSDGVLTREGQYPWQAMLCSPHFRGQYCGGVLVSPDCIVTAAHCVVQQGLHVQNITTCLGRLCGNCSEYDSQGNPQCSKPHRVYVHPQFDKKTFDNDIAVVKLRKPANLNCASVLPVCLPNGARDAPYIGAGKEGIVTGWGRVNSTVSRSICLRKGRVRLTSHRACGIRHKDPITKSMLCATDHNGACEGDSGGPLIVKNTRYGGRYVLAGIVSWGIGCGDREKLGVYTSVLRHLDWIKNSCGIRD